MRIRLWSVFVLAGLVIGAFLAPWSRAPGGDTCLPPVSPPSLPPHVKLACKTESAMQPLATPTMIVNSRRFRLKFKITDVGPSGVGSVKLWCTRNGRDWDSGHTVPQSLSEFAVEVDEEGRYGYSLVARSGVGVGSSPPRPGDAPQIWVEVDETKPKLRLLHAETGKGLENDCVTLAWTASDINLIPRPITLSTSISKDGPWTPVANNLENTGKYVWHMPKEAPYQFYLRVEAVDRAGNHAVDCWPEPIKVDRACPKAVILGIEGEKKDVPPQTIVPASLSIDAPNPF